MAANTQPVMPLTPNIVGAVVGATANAKSDGTGTIATDIIKLITGGTFGTFVEKVRFSPTANAAATATAGTVLRVFVSTKTSGATTSADTFLLQEIAAAAQTADQTTTATFFLEVPLNIKLPSGYTILVSSHVINNGNTFWQAVAFGGDF